MGVFVLFLGVVQEFVRGRWRVTCGGGLEGVDDARRVVGRAEGSVSQGALARG